MTEVSDNESDESNRGAHIQLRVEAPQQRWVDLMPSFQPGWVWLTGAGPGDAGLLTLQALHALHQADVIYHDALVSEDVLSLAPATTPRVFVGKRAAKPSPRQPEISRRLIESAHAGLRVLRLKGGDPFVFGRGAEEALDLREAGIPFRVVPGVTSGIGGLAYAGLPVSHRDFNQAFTFITAHDASGQLSSGLDWHAIAQGTPVLVIYMGFRLLGQIAERLISEGRQPSEPVAIVSKATTRDQRKLVTTLAAAERDVQHAGLEAPALIVVGRIVELHAVLDWTASMALPSGDTRISAAQAP
ncbi:MAG: uroporphyrinogen-III C-methyltransferase [Hyphomicrobiales bacterium]|nr:uroporphyrinogen-III C-methyltransferase [Hyphomicrobiales bacterium]